MLQQSHATTELSYHRLASNCICRRSISTQLVIQGGSCRLMQCTRPRSRIVIARPLHVMEINLAFRLHMDSIWTTVFVFRFVFLPSTALIILLIFLLFAIFICACLFPALRPYPVVEREGIRAERYQPLVSASQRECRTA